MACSLEVATADKMAVRIANLVELLLNKEENYRRRTGMCWIAGDWLLIKRNMQEVFIGVSSRFM